MSDVYTMKINDLPVEALTEIFDYLKVSDIKCARLTCHLWYNACNEFRILKKETFVLSGVDETFKSMVNVIQRSELKYLNLKFKETCLSSNYMKSFWGKCGSKIISLHLKDCEIFKSEMRKLVTHCNTLNELLFNNSKIDFNFDLLLKNLIEQNIRVSTLQNLVVESCKFITGSVFDKLCIVYPHIRSINIWGIKFDPIVPVNDEQEELTYRNVFNKVQTSAEMFEELNLDYSEGGFTDETLLELASVRNLKLKILHIRNHNRITSSGFIKFVSKQTKLENVCVVGCSWFDTGCLAHLINHCRGLKILTMQCEVEFLYDILKLIAAASNLKSFTMINSTRFGVTLIDTDISSIENNCLSYLNLKCFDLGYIDVTWIYKTFRKLKSVNYPIVNITTDDKLLSTICTHQNNVTDLLIRNYEYPTMNNENIMEGSLSQQEQLFDVLSLCKFKDLTVLEFYECKFTYFIDLTFPCLRQLLISNIRGVEPDVITAESIVYFCKKNPSVEYFLFGGIYLDHSIICSILKNLKRLHTFVLKLKTISRNNGEEKQFFNIDKVVDLRHQFLRLFYEEINCKDLFDMTISYVHIYDIFTNEWIRKKEVKGVLSQNCISLINCDFSSGEESADENEI